MTFSRAATIALRTIGSIAGTLALLIILLALLGAGRDPTLTVPIGFLVASAVGIGMACSVIGFVFGALFGGKP